MKNSLTSEASSDLSSDEEIRDRAYALYLAEGCPEGRAMDHWLAAEADCNVAMKPGEAPGAGEAEAAELQAAAAPKKTRASKQAQRTRVTA
ncbi:MAG: hypothetical protein JWO94_649 [Verrucomicrobiaceae bacterium]|nr:hypothetical protein [Verrucomicrobiaceae bacterium]